MWSTPYSEQELERPAPIMVPELAEYVRTKPLEVVQTLEPLLSDDRIGRIEQVLAARVRSIVVVLDHLNDPHNRAAVLRTCEALGVLEVHALTEDGRWPLSRRVTQGCHKWLDVLIHRSTEACARGLIERGFVLIEASEKTDLEALGRLKRATIDPAQPVALCLGNEHEGLTESLREQCSGRLGIPMNGFTKSFNVSVAAALLVSQLVEGRERGLEKDDEQLLRARYYALSVRAPLDVLRREVGR